MSLFKQVFASAVITGASSGVIAGTDTLFMTWFDDPTTSMVAQWLDAGPSFPTVGAEGVDSYYAVPQAEGIVVDGRDDDWGGKGLKLDAFYGGWSAAPNEDFEISAKLVWSDAGLYFFAEVRDDAWHEDASGKKPWTRDSIELFIGAHVGSAERIQLGITPAASAEVEEPLFKLSDRRKQRKENPLRYEMKRVVAGDRYSLEFFFPWQNFSALKCLGDELAFQCVFHDYEPNQRYKSLRLHPSAKSWKDADAQSRLKLVAGDETGGQVSALVDVELEEDFFFIKTFGVPTLAGQTLSFWVGDQEIGEAKMKLNKGTAASRFRVPDAPEGKAWGAIDVKLGEQLIGSVSTPAKLMIQPAESVSVFYKKRGVEEAELELPSRVTPFGPSHYSLQRVVFDGLSPDTEYEFRLAGKEERFYFKTLPSEQPESFVFAEGGDVGTSKGAVSGLHRAAAAWNPRFGLVGGDLAYGNGVDARAWEKYLQLWHQYMITADGLLIPQIVCIGNHEVPGGFNRKRKDGPFFYALFDGMYPENGYAVTTAGDYLAIVLLDSGHTTPVAGAQTEWLAQVLKDTAHYKHRFVAYHVPAYPGHRTFDSRGRAAIREHWVPLMEQYQVDAVFEHDDHVYKRTQLLKAGKPDPAGLLYLGDGAWGKGGREAATPEERPYLAKSASSLNVIRVTLEGQEQSYSVVDEQGRVIDRYPAE